MSLLLTYAVILLRETFACNYTPPLDDDVTLGKTEYEETRTKRDDSSAWDWIRIEIEYDNTFERLLQSKRETLEAFIIIARDYFESTFKVKRLRSLMLPSYCGGYYSHWDDSETCGTKCEKRCGLAIAPDSADYFSPCKCDKNQCMDFPLNYGRKLYGADFVLFVSVKTQHCREGP